MDPFVEMDLWVGVLVWIRSMGLELGSSLIIAALMDVTEITSHWLPKNLFEDPRILAQEMILKHPICYEFV